MEKFCYLCGEPLNAEGNCPNEHIFKRMCVNCQFCDNTDDKYTCINKENITDAVEKIKTAATEAAGGYEIDTFNVSLKPLVLKKPTNKCKRWELNEKVLNYVKNSFES